MKRRFIVSAISLRIVCLVFAVLLLSVTMLGRYRPAVAQGNAITLKFEAGFGSYYRADQWMPLLLNVSNSGPDVSGELHVTSGDTYGLSAGAFATNVDLPNGSNKEIFLYINLSQLTQEVKVEFATSSGILATDTQPLKALYPADLLYAVITESPRGTVDLQGVRTGTGDSHQINWRVDNVPDTSMALRAINVMVLTDVDSGNLSLQQRQAIGDWVRAGGHLIVTGGPNWQKTQAGVTDILPLKPTGSTTLASLPSLAAFAGHATAKLDAPAGSPIIVAQGTLTQGAKVLAQDSGIPLLSRRGIGEGFVDYLAVDPGIEPYPSWKERTDFWLTLFTTLGQQPSWSAGVVNDDGAFQAANLIKGLRLPDVFQLMRFLALYIIVIGPLNYLVLRRLKRPELGWITIPIIIVSCSAVAYFTGFSLRGTQATINRLALVQVWPNSDRAQVDGVIGILAPRRASYNVAVRDGMSLRTLQDSSNGSPLDVGSGPTIKEYPDYAAQDVAVDAGLTAVFTSSGFTKAPLLEANALITLPKKNANLRRLGGNPWQISGSVKNTTGLVLENAVVLASGGTYEIGTLNPDSSARFNFASASPQNFQSVPLSLGSSSVGRFYTGGGYSQGAYLNQRDLTTQDIMGHSYYTGYSFGYGENPEQQEQRRRQAFLHAVVNDQDMTGGRGDNVYLAAWSSVSPFNVELTGAASVTDDTTLYIFRLPVTLDLTPDAVEVPYAFLTWLPTQDSSQRVAAPYNINLQLGDRAVFRYNPLPLLRLKDVTQLDISLQVQGQLYNQGIISLWNWQDSKWVDINANSPLTSVTNPDRYIGPENAIQLMLEPAPGVRLISYDKIDVGLAGHLASAQP